MKTGMVVLNYNDAKETEHFVKMIDSYQVVDLICVVDNGSNDDSYTQLKSLETKNIKLLSSTVNKGYASGNNIGLKYLYENDCDYLVIANPDIIIEKTALIDFFAYMNSFPEYSVFGPTVSEQGTLNRGWKLSSTFHEILDNFVLINRLFKKQIQYKDKHYHGPMNEVDCVSGCFFGMTREVIEKVGYLDEGTFLYYEENILAKKMKQEGLKACVLNNVSIIHNHSVTINKLTNRYSKLCILKDSQYYYVKTYCKANKCSLFLLKKTADFACFIARLRTNKKVLTKNPNKRTKITILSLHMKVGGIEKAICSLANMLVDHYEVEIVNVYQLVEKPAFYLDKRVKVTYLSTNLRPNKEEFQLSLQNKKYFKTLKEGIKATYVLYKKSRLIKKVAKENNGDIIISSTLAFDKQLAKHQKHKLLIAWEHVHPNGDQKYVKKVQQAVKRFDLFIPCSKTLYDYYKEIITGPRCLYLPLCIDAMPEGRSDLTTNQITVMGRLSKEKAYDDMLRVFKLVYDKNKDARLNIVGEGETRHELDLLVQELGIYDAVTFHGSVVGDKKDKILKETSVFVTTSHFESFGLVLLEAMSYGIPCVSFDSAKGSLEIIEDKKDGYIIKDRSQEDMANQILELLKKPQKRISNYAIKKAKQYSYEAVRKIWLDTFQSFCIPELKTRVIFTSSAGGHYSELMELEELMKKYNSFILTEDHEMMKEIKENNKARMWYLRPGTKEHLFKFLCNFPFNIIDSYRVYRKVRPDVVIATGAHTTVPICYIAKLHRKKVIFIETFANITTKTLSGKLVYPIADLFLVQWEEMLELYPKAKYKGGLK